jgi:hypothetical protein
VRMTAYLVRIVRWQPAGTAAVPALALLAWTRWAPSGVVRPSAVAVLAGAAALVAAGLAFTVEDDAAVVLDATPGSLGVRRRRHLAVAAVATAVVWGLLLGAAPAGAPVGWATSSLLGTGTVGLAVAAVAARLRDPARCGVAGAVGAVVGHVASVALPADWALGPADPGATLRWLALTGVAAALLAAASRDPARRPARRWGR